MLLLLIFQRRLLYLPSRMPSAAAERAAAEHGFVPWRNASGQIIGWKLPASGTATASVLIVHGNAGSAKDREYLARPIHNAASVDVWVLEYPGYGARPGSPCKEAFMAAGEEAFQLLPRGLPNYLVSESLGAGVVCSLAEKHPAEVAGLALLVPYNNLASVAQSHFPFLPAYFLLRDRFNPSESLKNYRGPIQFVVAGADEVIPSKFGQRLFDGYGGSKTLQVIPNAHHNDVAEQSAEWWREVFSFWKTSGTSRGR
jgi:pimeloyl-ACP methyl ester carboxylesterase